MRRAALLAGTAAALLLAGCGSAEPSFSYGSGVHGPVGGANPPGLNPALWASDGRPPWVQWPPAPGEKAIAHISIPALRIDAAGVFDRGLDSSHAMQIAPGYAVTRYEGSAFFGASNTVLYAHDDIEGGIFGKLGDLRAGDQVVVQVGASKLTYVISAAPTVVPPGELSILAPTSQPRLTLFTCTPLWRDDHRIYVTAVPAH